MSLARVEISFVQLWRTQTCLYPYAFFFFFHNEHPLTKPLLQFLEVQAQHAFIRDEHSKGRWDAALTRSLFTFMMEVFERTVGRDLGPKTSLTKVLEHVC
jgi:hypothetical protein